MCITLTLQPDDLELLCISAPLPRMLLRIKASGTAVMPPEGVYMVMWLVLLLSQFQIVLNPIL